MDKTLIPNISVDSVVFGFDTQHLHVLLISRSVKYEGKVYTDWKFPGDLVKWDESLEESSRRILMEQTGLQNIYMKQLKAYGNLGRLQKHPYDMAWLVSIDHPESRVITIPFYSLVNLTKDVDFKTSLNGNARWFTIDQAKTIPLAFDHDLILKDSLESLREEMKSKPIAFELLPEKFTLSQLQRVYEVIFETTLDRRNFRKKISTLNYIIQLSEKEKNVPHRPASLYMFSREVYLKLKEDNFNFAI